MLTKKSIFSILSLCFISINADSTELALSNLKEIKSIHARQEIGNVNLFHDGSNFYVKDKSSIKKVERHDIDPLLRKMSAQHLDKFQKNGYIYIKQLSDGEYKLNSHIRGIGGGAGGASAGVWIGWTLTNVVGHGAIWIGCRGADMIVPGAGAAAEVGLHAAAAPAIAGAAKIVALGTGMFGAVFTGPA